MTEAVRVGETLILASSLRLPETVSEGFKESVIDNVRNVIDSEVDSETSKEFDSDMVNSSVKLSEVEAVFL